MELPSLAMREVMHDANAAASRECRVLISGERGVGKTALAEYLHQHSRHAQKPMASVTCPAATETQFESALFGLPSGTMTDAPGTLFLDEVAGMSLRMQAMLCRALEAREGQGAGPGAAPALDARLIAATSSDLVQRCSENQFRDDLFYRLNVVWLVIPPLRERTEDIRPLLEHYLAVFQDPATGPTCEILPDALQYLEGYAWPGNVRELRDFARDASAVCAGGRLHLPTARRLIASGAVREQPARSAAAALRAGYEPFGQGHGTRQTDRKRVAS
jgi:DNA-binding NtrC family response regulator